MDRSTLAKPPRLYLKSSMWYHVSAKHPRSWTRLSADYTEAVMLWHQCENGQNHQSPNAFSVVARRYVKEVLPQKARRTRIDNEVELRHLLEAFGNMDISTIQPWHVRRYMDARGATAKIRANREKALLSHIFNKSREWGYTNTANPCQGVKGFRETGRTIYVSNTDFQKVLSCADRSVANVMDLLRLTAQRPADVLKMRWRDVYDEALHVQQNKTGARLAIATIGSLAEVLSRIKAQAHPESIFIIEEANFQPLKLHTLQARFSKARNAAGIHFQLRDIRAKAATDLGDLAHAQMLLGHRQRSMTEHYVRARKGVKVMPLP